MPFLDRLEAQTSVNICYVSTKDFFLIICRIKALYSLSFSYIFLAFFSVTSLHAGFTLGTLDLFPATIQFLSQEGPHLHASRFSSNVNTFSKSLLTFAVRTIPLYSIRACNTLLCIYPCKCSLLLVSAC